MKKKTLRNIAIALIAIPIPLLICTIVMYSLLTFLFIGLGEATYNDTWLIVANLTNVLLGFVGIMSVIGIILGIPAGIIILAMSEKDKKKPVKKQK